KTTTAQYLADWLSRCGEDVRAFDEGAADHPIRTRRGDELPAAPAPGDPSGYAASQGRRPAERWLRDEQTIICESRLLPTPGLPPWPRGGQGASLLRGPPGRGGPRRAVPGLPAAGRHRGRDRARPPGPRRAVVLAQCGLRAGPPVGPPPRPARPRCGHRAVPG